MEKKKLRLNELKVQSFITELEKEGPKTMGLQGGITGRACETTLIIRCLTVVVCTP